MKEAEQRTMQQAMAAVYGATGVEPANAKKKKKHFYLPKRSAKAIKNYVKGWCMQFVDTSITHYLYEQLELVDDLECDNLDGLLRHLRHQIIENMACTGAIINMLAAHLSPEDPDAFRETFRNYLTETMSTFNPSTTTRVPYRNNNEGSWLGEMIDDMLAERNQHDNVIEPSTMTILGSDELKRRTITTTAQLMNRLAGTDGDKPLVFKSFTRLKDNSTLVEFCIGEDLESFFIRSESDDK